MNRVIGKLSRVKEIGKTSESVAKKFIGDYFRLTRVIVGERGIFEKVNSENILSTSKVKKIEIQEGLIFITTENSVYYFEVL